MLPLLVAPLLVPLPAFADHGGHQGPANWVLFSVAVVALLLVRRIRRR